MLDTFNTCDIVSNKYKPVNAHHVGRKGKRRAKFGTTYPDTSGADPGGDPGGRPQHTPLTKNTLSNMHHIASSFKQML